MSIIYSNAIVSVRSSKMLTVDRIRRMVAAQTAADAAKILFECGYDEQLLTTQPERDDLIINAERKRTIEEFNKLCPDKNVKYCVMARFDYHNAMTLYGREANQVDPDALYSLGNIDLDKLKTAIAKKSYTALPDPMASALSRLDKNSEPSPIQTEVELSRAMYQDIFANAKRNIAEYYRAEVDMMNLRVAAKSKLFGQKYENMFVEGGTIAESSVRSLLTKNPNDVKVAVANPKYSKVLDALVTSMNAVNLVEFENVAGETLIEISKNNSDDLFSINMLFYWFIKKMEELRIVKTILMGKKFGKTKEELREDLRGVL